MSGNYVNSLQNLIFQLKFNFYINDTAMQVHVASSSVQYLRVRFIPNSVKKGSANFQS